MKNETMIDLRQEMCEDMKQEQYEEYLMRSDFDHFCDRHSEEIEEFSEAFNKLNKALRHYGYELNDNEILSLRI